MCHEPYGLSFGSAESIPCCHRAPHRCAPMHRLTIISIPGSIRTIAPSGVGLLLSGAAVHGSAYIEKRRCEERILISSQRLSLYADPSSSLYCFQPLLTAHQPLKKEGVIFSHPPFFRAPIICCLLQRWHRRRKQRIHPPHPGWSSHGSDPGPVWPDPDPEAQGR
jgi:hypothetical protein